MQSKPDFEAVRVNGEVIVLHCYACGTAHCVNVELCVPGELAHMVCSNGSCKMSMFLVNELVIDDYIPKPMTKIERNPRPSHSRFWK